MHDEDLIEVIVELITTDGQKFEFACGRYQLKGKGVCIEITPAQNGTPPHLMVSRENDIPVYEESGYHLHTLLSLISGSLLREKSNGDRHRAVALLRKGFPETDA